MIPICSAECPSRCCRKLLLVSSELLLCPAANHSPFSPKVLNAPFSHNSTVEVEGGGGTSRASGVFYSCWRVTPARCHFLHPFAAPLSRSS